MAISGRARVDVQIRIAARWLLPRPMYSATGATITSTRPRTSRSPSAADELGVQLVVAGPQPGPVPPQNYARTSPSRPPKW